MVTFNHHSYNLKIVLDFEISLGSTIFFKEIDIIVCKIKCLVFMINTPKRKGLDLGNWCKYDNLKIFRLFSNLHLL